MIQQVTLRMTAPKSYVLTDGRTLDQLNPKELLLASTLICTGITAMAILEKKRVTPSLLEISLSGTLDTDTVQTISVFTSFQMTYRVACKDATEQARASQAIDLTHEKHCGGIRMLEKVAPITREVEITTTEQ